MVATTSTEANERIARRVPEDIATGKDLSVFDEIYADRAVEHDPMGDHEGREWIRADMERLLDAFPDLTATVEECVTEGDTVAMRVTLRGTHDGEFMGMAPTGRSFEVGNVVFTHIEGGMITERWVYPDMLGMLTQLGFVQSPFE